MIATQAILLPLVANSNVESAQSANRHSNLLHEILPAQ
jgi:hypothetical protein